MDKAFEKKVKQKRIRTIAVVVVVLAAIVYLIAGTKVEKADYTDSLAKEIQTAQNLYDAEKENVGNGKDQYATYTLLNFEKQIFTAQQVLDDENSEYTVKKQAYEEMKAQIDQFKKDKNNPVLTAEEAKALIDEKGVKELEAELAEKKTIQYTVEGKQLEKAVTMNFTAKEEGPYYEEINTVLAEKKLQGQVISFYQEGTFGGKIQVKTPIYSEKEDKGYAYKVDLEKGKMRFVSEADIDVENQTAVFTVEEGGDYVVLTEKIHKDKKTDTVDVETDADDPQEEQQSSNDVVSDDDKSSDVTSGDSEAADDDDREEGPSKDEPAQAPEDDDTMTVSLEIRCDTLAADLSKLRDPALEAYVPADGIILSLAEVEVKKGATVYDILDMVCRNKGIHMEAVYTPSYGADYIEGINYLYEFDAGEQSGWMYKVNGVFPNYGCSDYVVEDGDSIVWAYTCNMGKDIGKN